MQMQYDAGNISGYLSYKQFYDYMGSTDSKEDYSKMLEQYAEQIKEKIKNGETEPTYQIGGQSFTEEEWKKLIEKIDKDIEQIQAEQAERMEKQEVERRFDTFGPNAPEEVKQAWMEAAEETGVNAGGKLSHITQLDVQRVVKWYNGENPDVLGTTTESARRAVEQALYDLEHPLEPHTNKSADVQQSIEKEKEFYRVFLEKLSVI